MEKEEAEKTDKQTGSMEPQIMIETLTTEQTKINTNSNNRAYNITPLTINIREYAKEHGKKVNYLENLEKSKSE